MSRRLRAVPSNTEQLAQWQLKLVQKLETMHNEAFQKRQPLITFIQELPAPKGQDALHDVAFALQIAGCQPDEAHQKAMDVLRPDSSHFTGSRDTCILQWSFKHESFWRGLSDNKKIIRLSRSMVTAGFKQDEPIRSRTFDLSGDDDHGLVIARLLFGDGQARGLAVRLAWQLILHHFCEHPDHMGEPEAVRVMQSLLNIPTVFEESGSNTLEDLLVAQAVRQNVKAQYTLPMNTLEWTQLILSTSGQKLGLGANNRQNILQCMKSITSKYDAHIEVDAHDMQPVAKRPRKGRKSKTESASVAASVVGQTMEVAPEPDQLNIGTRRLNAIATMLSRGTEEAFKKMQMHLVWAGDWTTSALTDEILGETWLWPNSIPDSELVPDAVSYTHLPLPTIYSV